MSAVKLNVYTDGSNDGYLTGNRVFWVTLGLDLDLLRYDNLAQLFGSDIDISIGVGVIGGGVVF